MIEYIIPENPDDRILKKAISFIQEGLVVAFPTDTNWVLAASPYHKDGLLNIHRIKDMEKTKHLSLMCESLAQISQVAEVSTFAFRIMKKVLPGPFTFILNPSKDLPRPIKSYHKDGQIGVRIPQSILCQRLIHFMGNPLLITSIGEKMAGLDVDADLVHYEYYTHQIYGYQIDDALGNQVKMVIDPGELELLGGSTVVDLTVEGEINILREGPVTLSI